MKFNCNLLPGEFYPQSMSFVERDHKKARKSEKERERGREDVIIRFAYDIEFRWPSQKEIVIE